MRAGVEALVLDLDGVVILRPPYQAKATADYKRQGLELYAAPTNLVQITREIRQSGLGLGELGAFVFNTMRWVYPDVSRSLSQIKGIDIYGNTGRSNKEAWVAMTKWQLRMGGVEDRFQDVFFKPKDVETRDSKLGNVAFLLERYSRVRCVDDNPADLLPILNKFPEQVEGVLMEDRSTKQLLARVDRKHYPNLTVVSRFRDGVQDLILQAV
ncbi:hypothetical protein KKE78_01630 [Patescibacteria group bacterium]|nr:hypothetical protein [Patescibacteria group bacterium]